MNSRVGRRAPDLFLRISAMTRVLDSAAGISFWDAAGAQHEATGTSGDFVRLMLDGLRTPRTEGQLRRWMHDATGEVIPAKLLASTLQVLLRFGVVEAIVPTKPPKRGYQGTVTLALCGGIAAAFAPLVCEQLVKRRIRVRCIMSKSARKFVRKRALEAITHETVHQSMWPPSEPREPVPHLTLAASDLVVIYPATATTLFRIAHGDCSTLPSAVALSSKGPVLLVPAMNIRMLDAPAVRRNLERLRADGFHIALPGLGFEVAEAPLEREPRFGATPPVSIVVAHIEHMLSVRPQRA
jgi:3-polyprenyl-4-hydroxybenzoate decarboxylase